MRSDTWFLPDILICFRVPAGQLAGFCMPVPAFLDIELRRAAFQDHNYPYMSPFAR
jgi:hypothetical protein